MGQFSEQERQLAAEMDRLGAWPDALWVRRAMAALPRHRFAPDRLWRWNGHRYVPVDRGSDPGGWAAEVYAGPYASAITQVDDERPTSSLSCQSVVADMLDSLDVEPGHRVLELGTGTGWNAALLAWRAGDAGRVTTVEVDRALAARARERLSSAGAKVAVEHADGADGWPPAAPYDRVVATYAVDRVPAAWIAQARPGALIVTPWGRLGHVALRIAEDGHSATGWVHGLAQFMPARGTPNGARDFAGIRAASPAATSRELTRDLAPLRDDPHLLFALRVALPDVRVTTARDEAGTHAWLHDDTASWAALSIRPDGRAEARQGGPRRLADELETAWDQWLALGSPELYAYGLTADLTRNAQYAWCHDPTTGPRWPLPD